MTQLALVRISDLSIVEVFDSSRGRLDLPNGDILMPPIAGWEGGGGSSFYIDQESGDDTPIPYSLPPAYRIVSIVPSELPPGKIRVGGPQYEWVEGELHEQFELADIVIQTYEVDAERDRRVADGFTFGGHKFQSRVEDQKRIAGAFSLALAAIGQGAPPGNLQWHGGDVPFGWIDADNNIVPMDAQTVLAFGQVAAAWESDHVMTARNIKNMNPIPPDFADDSRWPKD